MIDVLLRFPSQEVAAQIGAGMGYSMPDGQGGWKTTQATLTLGICVIGEHFRPGPTPADPWVGDGQWWVMVRSLVDIPIPDAVAQFVVPRDPTNPAIPNQKWAD